MLAQFAVFALSLAVMTAATVAPALADDKRKHHRHHGWHGHDRHWQGGHHHRNWNRGHHHKHWHGNSARIVIWQPAPVYRAYPAPVYAPAPVYMPAPVVHQPVVNAVPLRHFQDTGGRYCREYQRTADIGGVPQQIYGTACMMPDSSWQIVSE
jgi:hypothetical protein